MRGTKLGRLRLILPVCVMAAVAAALGVGQAVTRGAASSALPGAWVQLPQQPPAAFQGVAYDDAAQSLVGFGSVRTCGVVCYTSFYMWLSSDNGLNWIQQPDPLPGASVAYDPGVSALLKIGPTCGSGFLCLYEFRVPFTFPAGPWTVVTTPVPARWNPCIAYDAASRTLFLFGGTGTGNSVLNDTWGWDGTTWTQFTPKHVPPGAYGNCLAYDPAQRDVMLVTPQGGQLSTWSWHSHDWQRDQPLVQPPAPYCGFDNRMSLSSDLADGTVVLDVQTDLPPGSCSSALQLPVETWVWGGSTWTDAGPQPGPIPIAYDPALLGPVGTNTTTSPAGDQNSLWLWQGAPSAGG